MKTKLYLEIACRIIILCVVGMIMTFIPDHLRDFFGDVKNITYNSKLDYTGLMDGKWIWGARRYWYFWMCSLLFILSVVKAWLGIRELIEKEYNVKL